MKNRTLYFAIIITVLATLGLTRLWDHFNQDKESHKNPGIHVEHEDHDDHSEEEIVYLSSSELEEFNILIANAEPGDLIVHRDLPGEIAIDPDRLAHIVPRFPGLVKEVRKSLGEQVEKGEVLAIVESNESLVTYEVRSLLKGKVIEVHLTEGEVISDLDHSFVVADLSKVWVNFSVYQKDLPFVQQEQTVEIDLGPQLPITMGTISYISPILDEHTRTATARVILDNPDGYLRPGLFVTGKVIIEKIDVPILVPKTALQSLNEETVIFIRTEDEFLSRSVEIGRTNEISVEILAGLSPGQEYVSQGGFTLKAELAKGSFGEGHGH